MKQLKLATTWYEAERNVNGKYSLFKLKAGKNSQKNRKLEAIEGIIQWDTKLEVETEAKKFGIKIGRGMV